MDKHQMTMILNHGQRISTAIACDGRGLRTRLHPRTISHLAEIRYHLFCMQFPPFMDGSTDIKDAILYVDFALQAANAGRTCVHRDDKERARRHAFEYCQKASDCINDALLLMQRRME